MVKKRIAKYAAKRVAKHIGEKVIDDIKYRKSNAKKAGSDAGARAGRMTKDAVSTAEYTMKEISDFTTSFIENFKKEIRKMDDDDSRGKRR